MIIHNPKITSGNNEIMVSSRVEFQSRNVNLPPELCFKFPLANEDYISDRSDGFLIAMILMAMQAGEDIHVKGVVSPRLLTGLCEYQRTFNLWFPRRFRTVEINCESLLPSVIEGDNRAVVSAFSGGIDSFFTLWSHHPCNDDNSETQISHALFSHGFDISLDENESFTKARQLYEDMLRDLNIGLLVASSNIHEFDTRRDWGIFHGTTLISMAHILGRRTIRFYVPSSHTYGNLIPWGSDPRIDHLLSTESMEVVHDGAGFTRVEKTDVISGWPETYNKLRVCPQADGVNNCSRCEKCLRTMVTLELTGALTEYTTFTPGLPLRLVRRCRYFNSSDFTFPKEILGRAASLKRYDILFIITYAVVRSRVLQLLRFVKIKLIAAWRSIHV